MFPKNVLGSIALLITSAGMVDGATATLLPSDAVKSEKEQLPSSSQLYDQKQHVPRVANPPRLLRSGLRTSGIGNGEAPTQAAQEDDYLQTNSAAAVLLKKRPARQRDRTLHEYDGKLKLKWGKDGQHAPDNHIDITEKKHRDIPNAQNKNPPPGDQLDQDGSSTANTFADIDPILYYCTHVYACESLTNQVSTLANNMESLPSYEGMIVQCEGVTTTSSLTQIEFCNDARLSYQSEAKAMLEQKEATEAAMDMVCNSAVHLEEQSPFKITENICDDNFDGMGGIVPQGCVDTMQICGDGTVICQGGSMPQESCPGENDCDRFCGLELAKAPCICTEKKKAVDGDIGEFWVGDTGDVEKEEEGGDDSPTVVKSKQSEEKDATESLADTAEEEIDEAAVVLEAIEEEQKVAAEIEELRAKIAQLEAMGGGNRA